MGVTKFMIAGCIYTGVGALDNLEDELRSKKLKKPLIITDKGIVKAGIVEKVQKAIKAAGIDCAVFDGVVPNPTDTNVADSRALYDKEGCDSIVAVGGGSSIDCAKGAAVIIGGTKDIHQYLGFNKMERPMPFFVAIPTTAGTGSESTQFTVITSTQEERPRKVVVGDSRMLPHVAIIDPLLMAGMPPVITASTGMDAMTHAIESYITKDPIEYADSLCMESIRKIANYLPRAVGNGADLEAREQVAYAQTAAGMAFSNTGLGLVHGMAHPLSSFYDISHGDANAVLLPYIMEYNKIVRLEKIANIANLIGIKTCCSSTLDAANAAIAGIHELNDRIGVPKTISELAAKRKLKVDKKDIPALAFDVMRDINTPFNPRIVTIEDVEALYTLAW